MSEIYKDEFRGELLTLTEEKEYDEVIVTIKGEGNGIHSLTHKEAGEMCTELSEWLIKASEGEYPICGVRQQSELLKAFMNWQVNQDISQFDDCDKTIKEYLKSLL